MILTSADLWLYQIPEYIDVHERLHRESCALTDLLVEIQYSPSSGEEREEVSVRSRKGQALQAEIRELRERLMAAHSTEGNK